MSVTGADYFQDSLFFTAVTFEIVSNIPKVSREVFLDYGKLLIRIILWLTNGSVGMISLCTKLSSHWHVIVLQFLKI